MNKFVSIVFGIALAFSVWAVINIAVKPEVKLDTVEQVEAPKKLEELTGINSVEFENKTFHFIADKAASWDELYSWVKSCGDDLLWIDNHFNANGSVKEYYGFMCVANSYGVPYAELLNVQHLRIYIENGFKFMGRNWVWETNSNFAVTSRASKDQIPVVISEFGFIDDPKNEGMVEFLKTEHKRLAEALLLAALNSDKRNIVFTIGHYRDAGSPPAKLGEFDEIKFSFGVYNELIKLLASLPDSNDLAAPTYIDIGERKNFYKPKPVVKKYTPKKSYTSKPKPKPKSKPKRNCRTGR